MIIKEPITILLIESDPEDALLLQKLMEKKKLHRLDCAITVADRLEEALRLLSTQSFSLIITNLFLSDSTGLDTFLALHKTAESTPILIISGIDDESLALEAVSQGAQDYIPKSEANAHLLGRLIRYALERHHLVESLRLLSFSDELTGLYNRRGFFILMEQQIELALRLKKGLYLFLIDLDALKEINDHHGHSEGDRALVDTACVLKQTFRSSDIIARIGGDEFAILSLNVLKDAGEKLKTHLEGTLEEFKRTEKRPFLLSLSMGMAYFDPSHPQTIKTLMDAADQNLYTYKRLKH